MKLFNDLHKAHQQFTSDRTSLVEQQNENEMVKKEIDLLEEGTQRRLRRRQDLQADGAGAGPPDPQGGQEDSEREARPDQGAAQEGRRPHQGQRGQAEGARGQDHQAQGELPQADATAGRPPSRHPQPDEAEQMIALI